MRSVVAHGVANIVGHIFSLVIVHAPPLPLTERMPIEFHQDYLAPVHPSLAPFVGIAPEPARFITGALRVNGGVARDLSIRYTREFSAKLKEFTKDFGA